MFFFSIGTIIKKRWGAEQWDQTGARNWGELRAGTCQVSCFPTGKNSTSQVSGIQRGIFWLFRASIMMNDTVVFFPISPSSKLQMKLDYAFLWNCKIGLKRQTRSSQNSEENYTKEMSAIVKHQPKRENKTSRTASYSSEHILQEKKGFKNSKTVQCCVIHCLVYFYLQICTWIIVKLILFKTSWFFAGIWYLPSDK